MLNRLTELRLIARSAILDDRDAFGQLVVAYEAEVRRLFMRLTRDPALADDLAQETFLKAYISIKSFKGISRFSTWIYRIAYNEFYDWSRKSREASGEDLENLSHESVSDNMDARIDVNGALLMLNEVQRSVAVLFFMEDKPVKEVAKIMNMPEGTVKSHISRAKQNLVKLLKDK